MAIATEHYISFKNLIAYDSRIKTYLENKDTDLQTKLEKTIGKLDADGNPVALTIGTNTYSSVKSYVDALNTAADTRLDDLELILKDFLAESAKKENAVKGYIDTSIANLDATVRSNITVAEDKTESVSATKKVGVKVVETGGKLTGVTVMENDIASADALTKLQNVIGYSELSETSTDATAKSVNARIKAVVEEIGTKASGSGDTAVAATGLYEYVDNAAADAVATVVANADSDFDTLKEVADWIKSDKTGAAKMQTDISTLKTDVGTASVAAVKFTQEEIDNAAEGDAAYGKTTNDVKTAAQTATGLTARIETLESAVGQGGSVDDQINTKIANLGADINSASNTEEVGGKGANVNVEVVEAGGKITAVKVTESDIASAAALTALTGVVGKASEAAVGTEGSAGYKAAVAASGLTARIESLETAVGAGGSVDSQIDTKINALNSTVYSLTNADGTSKALGTATLYQANTAASGETSNEVAAVEAATKVKVTVAEVGGKLSGVTVNTTDIASAALLAQEVAKRKEAIAALDASFTQGATTTTGDGDSATTVVNPISYTLTQVDGKITAFEITMHEATDTEINSLFSASTSN